eukprot:16439716-Heterocapsa_arctica.AAC.1
MCSACWWTDHHNVLGFDRYCRHCEEKYSVFAYEKLTLYNQYKDDELRGLTPHLHVEFSEMTDTVDPTDIARRAEIDAAL